MVQGKISRKNRKWRIAIMEKETEKKLNELIDKLNSIITEQGLVVSGNGMIANNLKKMLEKLDKLDNKLYWIEKRDKERTEFTERIK
jgi:uncharacterized coiled-coil protein SlyX